MPTLPKRLFYDALGVTLRNINPAAKLGVSSPVSTQSHSTGLSVPYIAATFGALMVICISQSEGGTNLVTKCFPEQSSEVLFYWRFNTLNLSITRCMSFTKVVNIQQGRDDWFLTAGPHSLKVKPAKHGWFCSRRCPWRWLVPSGTS